MAKTRGNGYPASCAAFDAAAPLNASVMRLKAPPELPILLGQPDLFATAWESIEVTSAKNLLISLG
jgi:hypothetical protein